MCVPLKEHVVANSALYVVTVNGMGCTEINSGPKQRILDVLGQKSKMFCSNFVSLLI